ncbi:Poly(A) RNA polymerase cid13 [Paramyrothecium foliicola]|nr:Poly(A) RNA polymerase cid13 [Paramyrothecium foliicola]
MDARSATAETHHSYPSSPWINPSTPTTPAATAPSTPSVGTPNHATALAADGSQDGAAAAGARFPSHLDFLPFLFPQQSNIYQAQLLHYNKLISPARGGGLHSPALPPVVTAPHVPAAPRSRSSSKVSIKDAPTAKGHTTGGHGGRSHQTPDKNRSVITSKEPTTKMAAKQVPEASSSTSKGPSHRSSAAASVQAQAQIHSSSVPSTPHQHARQFSFESREPSPTSGNNHSPRSAYSETNGTLPSLRPLPPRLGGCKYETAQINSRRRIPYSVGSDRLEKVELRNVKSKLSEDEERKLATDMREIYDRLLPTEKVEANRKRLVQKLEKIFNDEWPGHDIRVHLFGSSGNLLCSDDSDVDICITTPWRDMEGVCMIADLLARRGMEKVVCISAAKVPIVKIWDPELGLACDMNVNNTVALENTRMVRTYVETDPRVRQLAMIIKHWTRRRIVNDAAFGGTLSSYTWICLIIAFLQLRNPPVLPSLHQLPHKLSKADGTTSDFADNVKKFKGFGNKNKSSEAELLFQFFRFYAHEFDYDKHVLSIRLGKLVTKTEKKWNYAINNQLCVEEPFNTGRNLGNTADEYSFRGLHLELRRAFDLISAAKLEEACEQYVFPKEEERVWSRPAPQPRPVLLRSSSQTQSGRGGRGNHRGGARHNNNVHRNNNNNRRASSSVPTYDANMFMPAMGMQQDLSWYQNPQFQFQYAQQDLMTQMAFHQENMRQLHLYAQSPAFLQHQNLAQQRVSSQPASGQQSADRSRTSSFDNAPLTAPIRPDLYALYGISLGHQFYQQTGAAGYGTYPSSPATTGSAPQEYRRPLQRSTAGTDASTSNSSLRSQSQPASRSPSAQNSVAGYPMGTQQTAAAPVFVPRQVNGVPIPSFMSDDVDFDETPKATNDSPVSDDGKPSGLFPAQNASPPRHQPAKPHGSTNGLAFGDLADQSSSGRRRLSTDQLPQTILDRRMKRTSRSPSPLGHARASSAGTASAPLISAPFSGSQNKNLSRPLVVNGSGLKTSISANQKTSPISQTAGSEQTVASGYDNPLQINPGLSINGNPVDVPKAQAAHNVQAPQSNTTPVDGPPVVVNGSSMPVAPPPADDASFRERIAMMNSYYMNPQAAQQEVASGNMSRLSPSARQRLMARQPQNGVIAPLDLAIRDHRGDKSSMADLASHLSPVYETHMSSPTAVRKFEITTPSAEPVADEAPRNDSVKMESVSNDIPHPSQETAKPMKTQKVAAPVQRTAPPRENGHIRSAKSESDGGWQKAGKGKKKGLNGATPQPLAELPPRHESERKGG